MHFNISLLNITNEKLQMTFCLKWMNETVFKMCFFNLYVNLFKQL